MSHSDPPISFSLPPFNKTSPCSDQWQYIPTQWHNTHIKACTMLYILHLHWSESLERDCEKMRHRSLIGLFSYQFVRHPTITLFHLSPWLCIMKPSFSIWIASKKNHTQTLIILTETALLTRDSKCFMDQFTNLHCRMSCSMYTRTDPPTLTEVRREADWE